LLSSVTAGSGLFIVVLGTSNVLDAVLGDKAQATLGIVTVAGAIAAALTGAAGVLVLTLRTPGSPDVTAGGLLASSVIAFGAAGGQVWAIAVLLQDLDLGFAEVWVWVAAGLASLMLAAYAYTSLTGLLSIGTKPPPPEPSKRVPESVYAAAIVAAASPNASVVDSKAVEKLLSAVLAEPAAVPAAQRREAPCGAEPPQATPTPTPAFTWRARRLRGRSALP
jgi:hypothetical protein